ncbi:MAG: glycerol-3-phosphate dehydrogenase/oxidase [Anaerolineae bacterium]|nr:glycerol-3-phosphate dehydrogenase/oxidase [Anaerolineae bacterium]
MTAPRFPDFSAATRQHNLQRLPQETWDILVVGGGITGTSIARDAALRGFRTALLEKGDFASGTSSRSSRLAHGGIRYLESYEFALVFEALRERGILRRIAPHLVHPTPFIYPVYRGKEPPLWKLAAGMWLYDALALFRNFRLHRIAGRGRIREWEPVMGQEGLQGGAEYYDSVVYDARLTLAVARSAHRAGAALVNHAAVVSFSKEDGRIVGVGARDALSGKELAARACVVVNATGVWGDALMQMDDPDAPHHLRPSKGIHILVRRERMGHWRAVVFFSPRDGRILFLIPWGAFSIIGTTDTEYEGDLDKPYTTAEDVAYVLEAANAAFPEAGLRESDIVSNWAGLRPLVFEGDASSTYKVSREHRIFVSPSGLVSISGGKLTTAREMARQVVEIAQKRLAEAGIHATSPCRTHLEPLDPAPLSELQHLADARGRGHTETGPAPALVEHLIGRYGSEYRDLLAWMAADPGLAEPLVVGLPYRWAEVRYALEREMALTLSDLLIRRIPLIYEAPDQGLEVVQAVSRRMGKTLGWSEEQIHREEEDYRDQVALTRLYRNRNGEVALVKQPAK